MRFLDEAKIHLKAGDGGDGCISFRHAKFLEFGGPDGGAGGNGGSIFVVAVSNVNTLIDYRYRQHIKAKKGENGAGNGRTGSAAPDITIKVPVGTQVLDDDKITEIADMSEENQTVMIAQGGRGGLGNVYFKTSTNQAPRKAQKGTKGEEKSIWLKLKLVADVGLVGMPNAGKSTIIAAMTNAKAKIRDYQFSTLTPQLGVLRLEDRDVVMADIPGLVEDAHLGKGLGCRFLSHIERCSILLHVVDASGPDPIESYLTIRRELVEFSEALAEKSEIVVLNKIDLVESRALSKVMKKLSKDAHSNILAISAKQKQGCSAVANCISQLVGGRDKW
jgi:GTP-binding protein